MCVTSLPVVLDYSVPSSADAQSRRRGRWRWVWLVMSLPALVVPFVPFACHATPVGTVGEAAQALPHLDREEIALTALAVPLIVGALLVGWRARVLWRPGVTRVERIIALACGGIMGACCGAVIVLLALGDKTLALYELLCLGIPAGLLNVGSVAWMTLRGRLGSDEGALAAMLAGYAPSAIMALMIFWDDRKIGWYLTIPCAAAAVAEGAAMFIGAVRLGRRQRRGEGGGHAAATNHAV